MPPDKQEDRNKAIDWARNLTTRPDEWVVWATEKTGEGKTDEMVQLAVTASDGTTLLNTLVRPLRKKKIPADATARHGITMDELADAPSYADLVPQLSGILKGKQVVAFDSDLEKRILRQTARQTGGRDFSLSWDCAGTYYSRFVGEIEESKKQYKPQALTRIEKSAVGNCRATLGVIRMIARTPVVKTRVRFA